MQSALLTIALSVVTLPRLAQAATGTIQDIEHVVLFMQENRAFDHVTHLFSTFKKNRDLTVKLQYFGTMAGVRGFGDPNVHVASNGRPVWFQ